MQMPKYKMFILFYEGISIYMYKTEPNNNNKKKNELINLGVCEDKLRSHYKILKNESLYILYIKFIEKGIQVAKLEYEVYYPLNGTNLKKLEVNICQNINVEILNKVNINANEIDKHNPKSGFYNDICYSYTSDKGTDMSLEDRKKQFIEKNYSLCEENCELKDYDEETKNAKCSCPIKINVPLISEITIDKERLKESFSNITNIANLNVMKCYNVLFSKQGILYNIGCYVMLPIILLHFITVIIFYYKDFKELKIIIQKIIYIKKNFKSINLELKSRNEAQTEKTQTIIRKRNKEAKNIGIKIENLSEIKSINNEKLYLEKENEIEKEKEINKNNEIEKEKEINKENEIQKDKEVNEENEIQINKEIIKENEIQINKEIIKENEIQKDNKSIKENEIEKDKEIKKDNEIQKDNDISSKIEIPLYLKYLKKKGLSENSKNEIDNINNPPIKKEKKRIRESFTINTLKTSENNPNTNIKFMYMKNPKPMRKRNS